MTYRHTVGTLTALRPGDSWTFPVLTMKQWTFSKRVLRQASMVMWALLISVRNPDLVDLTGAYFDLCFSIHYIFLSLS